VPWPLSEETHYKLLKRLEVDPRISQRELAKELGISLGKVNYCLKALADKGWMKVRNFNNSNSSNNKKAYAYFLTSLGLQEKAKISVQFLKHKVQEYEQLSQEIEELRREIAKNP
jgi:EPS-associated MarR family transcriptional regulator